MGLLLAGVMFFAVAAFVGIHLPQVATSIAGGVHFHAGSIAQPLWGRTTGLIRKAIATPRATSKGFSAARSWGSRRRNPPGNSLSA
jgi:type IV secretion system protein VirB6